MKQEKHSYKLYRLYFRNPSRNKKPTGVQLVFNFIAVLTTCSKNNYLNFAGVRKWNSQRHRLARNSCATLLREDTFTCMGRCACVYVNKPFDH